MRNKLNKTTVDAAKAAEKPYIIFDRELAGYGLKVTPKGKKIFIYQYRLKGTQKTKRITIGQYLDFVESDGKNIRLTVHSARDIAEILRGKVKSGLDPKVETRKVKEGVLTSHLLDQFISQYVKVKLKPTTQYGYKSYIENVIRPEFGMKAVTDISRTDIARLHNRNANQPCRANHIYATLSRFLSWCEDLGYIREGSNPCAKVKKYKIKGKERYLKPDENERLSHVIQNAIADGKESIYAMSALQLLRFTGARRNEILGLRWDWVDLENGIINLPDSKTGRKRIVINSAAKKVFEKIPKVAGNPFVIVGKKNGQHLVNIQKPWSRIRRLAGLEDVRVHDLRHTFASFAVANGKSLHVVGMLLGHKQSSTTYRYAHLADETLKEASEDVGSYMNVAS